jgi:hypothetical protein
MMLARVLNNVVGLSMAVTGCGAVTSPDAPDAPLDGLTIQITGTIAEAGRPIAAGATVDVIQISSGRKLATTSSRPAGMFSVAVPSHGMPVDAYLDVTSPGHLDTHVYLEPQLGSDRDVYVSVISDLQQLARAAGTQQPVGTGAILAQVFKNNYPAAGATVSAPFGTVCYTNSLLSPDCTRSATASDGLAWIFAVPLGTAVVSGQLGETTPLQSRQVSVRDNVLVQVGLEP